MDEAKRSGVTTLVMTVDMPMPGARYRDLRSGLSGANSSLAALHRLSQALTRPAWAWDVGLRGAPHTLGNVAPHLGQATGLEDFLGWMRKNFDPTVTWRDLADVREAWSGKLVVKGVLNVADAREAAALGADSIVVSNHGGRQLDGVASTVKALPPIVRALDGKISVLVDGGVRSGLDVVRFLSLGASGVLLGRLWAYALAARAQPGVEHVLDLVRSEMKVALALGEFTSVSECQAHFAASSAEDQRGR